MTTRNPIPARLAALKTTPTPDLKQQWRELFDSEPPPFNRRYLESRLAYRIQELAYGGLKPETVRRLERLGEELDGGDKKKRGMRLDRDRPITGTRLLREWQGVEYIVTVTADGFEWQGRPYKSLSAIARAITGTRWNGGRRGPAGRRTSHFNDDWSRPLPADARMHSAVQPTSCRADTLPHRDLAQMIIWEGQRGFNVERGRISLIAHMTRRCRGSRARTSRRRRERGFQAKRP